MLGTHDHAEGVETSSDEGSSGGELEGAQEPREKSPLWWRALEKLWDEKQEELSDTWQWRVLVEPPRVRNEEHSDAQSLYTLFTSPTGLPRTNGVPPTGEGSNTSPPRGSRTDHAASGAAYTPRPRRTISLYDPEHLYHSEHSSTGETHPRWRPTGS